MVKLEMRKSISEDEGESNILNENGKRPGTEDKGKKRLKTKSLYRQPTANELNRLQETEQLFNSNLFRLQIEEVLEEVKVKEKTVKRFQEWFTHFKTYLNTIPNDDTEYDLTEKTFLKKLKVKLPICNQVEKTKVMFKFYKFEDVIIVGSYALGCSINSKLIIDLQVNVPAAIYTKNDSVNYRYHKKRAAYLAYIASHLSKSEIIEDIKYTYLNSETKPIITLKPSGKLGNNVSISLNLSCDAEAYKLHRFDPSRNNLRESWLFMSDNQDSSDIGSPTPHYNSSVLSDLTATVNQDFLKEILLNSENLKQAVVLLKIWVRQRKLKVSGHVISMLVAYFVQTKRVNNIMSSYQIVRNVWIALKLSEWDQKGITLSKHQEVPLEEFHKHFSIVFVDRTGYYNICWEMCKGTYYALRRECVLAIEMLDNIQINSFMALFMTPVTMLMQFDHIISFKDLKQVKESVLSRTPKAPKLNYGLDHLALVTDTLYDLLHKGLANRVYLILQVVKNEFSWSIKKTLEKAKQDGYKENVSFGLILNPEMLSIVVDRGPAANLPEAEEFREFWGAKSELRRFRDGSITEACVWEGTGLTIPKQIVDYLLHLKYGVLQGSVFHWWCEVSPLCSDAADCASRVRAAAVELRALLTELGGAPGGLPLGISGVQGVSPVFSSTEPLPSASGCERNPRRKGDACLIKQAGVFKLPPYVPANKIIIELGHSGKWPGDLQAFRCLKAAFHLQIAEKLKTNYSLPTQAYPNHVDVLKDGLVFRLQIAHPKEITLLRREVIKGVVKFKETQESIQLYCDTVLMPRLRGALHGLDQRYPAFSPAVCLLKRWFSSQLLSLPEAVPALLVSHVLCVGGGSVGVSGGAVVSPWRALVAALRLLASTSWGTDALVVDFNGDMTREQISSIEEQYRVMTPRPHVFIATPLDGDCPSPWTRSLTPQMTSRACALARDVISYLEQALEHMKKDIMEIFIPSLVGYDVIIHLHPSMVPYYNERVLAPLHSSRKHKDPPTNLDECIPVVEFNPVKLYLEELREAYDDFALFFNDSYGGDIIAVLWRPETTRSLEILNASALKPVTVNGVIEYKVNKEALVEDFKILGKGLVKDIVVNSY